MKEYVNIAVPKKGDIGQEVLGWLGREGLGQEWSDKVVEIIGTVKKSASEDSVIEEIRKAWKEVKGVGPDYYPNSGWRAVFTGRQGEINGIPVMTYGARYPTISGIREGVGDIAFTGFDELLATMMNYLTFKDERITRYKSFNSGINPKDTDVMVLGRTPIKDHAGLFLLMGKPIEDTQTFRKDILDGRIPLYVKGRNEGLAYYFFGDSVDARSETELEEAVKSGGAAFDLVRSGKTVVENGMYVVGRPELVTESLVVVDRGKYEMDSNLAKIADQLIWKGSNDGYREWQIGLESVLRDQWIAPSVTLGNGLVYKFQKFDR